MRRSGFILGVTAPAALLTLLIQPVVREAADGYGPSVPTVSIAPEPLPGMRPASLALSPTRVAGVLRGEGRTQPVAVESQELGPKPVPRQPRRMVREGCETALSSLVGPEARRMTPGRCIS